MIGGLKFGEEHHGVDGLVVDLKAMGGQSLAGIVDSNHGCSHFEQRASTDRWLVASECMRHLRNLTKNRVDL